MTDRQRSLMRAVCENPGDDLPRLVYADWCEEHGDPYRAEFIRVQCQYPKCFDLTCECPHNPNGFFTGGTCPKPVRKVWEYIRDGLNEYGDTIPGMYINTRNFSGAEVTILRGFPDQVTITVEQLCGGATCRECDGSGLIQLDGRGSSSHAMPPVEFCKSCDGGRTEGLAKRLAEWPVTGVRLSGREPQQYAASLWHWNKTSARFSTSESTIPDTLFDFLEKDGWSFFRSYPTPDAARLALSRAAVDYIRAQAEPPLGAERKPSGPEVTIYPNAKYELLFTGDTP